MLSPYFCSLHKILQFVTGCDALNYRSLITISNRPLNPIGFRYINRNSYGNPTAIEGKTANMNSQTDFEHDVQRVCC